MTYDVWSQTGPQTDGKSVNLSRYVKGAGWFDPGPDHKVTALFSPRPQLCTTASRPCTLARWTSSCGAGVAPSVLRPPDLVYNSNPSCAP
jgi:hypothetical protein